MAQAVLGYTLAFDGLEPLLKQLGKLKRNYRRNALRNSVRAATKPIVQAAKAGVPVEHGFLKKALKVKIRVFNQGGTVAAIIGAERKKIAVTKGDQTKYINPARYIHLVEKGTKPHEISVPHWRNPEKKITLLHPGSPPRPFLRRAYENNRELAKSIMRQRLDEEIKKAVAAS